MKCPKCGYEVSEGSSACPICFAAVKTAMDPGNPTDRVNQPSTPVGQSLPPTAPPPNYLSPGFAPQPTATVGSAPYRTTLSGEVIATPPAQQPSFAPGYAPPGYGQRPAVPIPPPNAAPPYGNPQGDYRVPMQTGYNTPSKSNSGAVGLVIAVIVLLVVGTGVFAWWRMLQGPYGAASKLAAALKTKDWGTEYDMMYFPEEYKQQAAMMGGREAFINNMNMRGNSVTFSQVRVGSVNVTGDTATVRLLEVYTDNSGFVTQSKTEYEDLNFIKVNNEWKWDIVTNLTRKPGFNRPPGMGGF